MGDSLKCHASANRPSVPSGSSIPTAFDAWFKQLTLARRKVRHCGHHSSRLSFYAEMRRAKPVELKDVHLDHDKTFGEIYEGNPGPHLKEIFLRLQEQDSTLCQQDIQKWANKLRFLVLPNSTHQAVSQVPQALQLTEYGRVPDTDRYVAVSYCWKLYDTPFLSRDIVNESQRRFKIKAEGSPRPRPSIARGDVLSRAIKYAHSKEIQLLWIDQECIRQNDREDKEYGIQSMDLVYERASHPLGLLTTCIRKQAHLDALSLLLRRESLTRNSFEAVIEALELLVLDPWLTRAWVYQEAVASNSRMDLLIPYDTNLEKPSNLGSVAGEIILPLHTMHGNHEGALSYQVFLFWQSAKSDPDFNARAVRVLRLWSRLAATKIRGNCGLGVFKHLSTLRSSRVADKLAILGNICRYPVRLKIANIPNRSSFTAYAFALAMINGDLSFLLGLAEVEANNYPERGNGDNSLSSLMAAMTVSDSNSFSWTPSASACLAKIELPPLMESSYRIMCKLLPKGLLVAGWLWRIDKVACLPQVQAQYSYDFALDLSKKFTLRNVSYYGPQRPGLINAHIFWGMLRELVATGAVDLAQELWSRFSLKVLGRYTLPRDITNIIDPYTQEFLLQRQPYFMQEIDAYQLCSRQLLYRGFDPIAERVIRDGELWYGRSNDTVKGNIGLFHVNYLTEVLTLKAAEDCSPEDTPPMSWEIKRTDVNESGFPMLHVVRMIKGVWSGDDYTPSGFILA